MSESNILILPSHDNSNIVKSNKDNCMILESMYCELLENSLICPGQFNISSLNNKIRENNFVSKDEVFVTINKLLADNSFSYRIIKLIKIQNK